MTGFYLEKDSLKPWKKTIGSRRGEVIRGGTRESRLSGIWLCFLGPREILEAGPAEKGK